jgi:hypothetical protein
MAYLAYPFAIAVLTFGGVIQFCNPLGLKRVDIELS